MNWQKITFPISMYASGEAQSLINSFGTMLGIFPNVNLDKILICSRTKHDNESVIYYFSPEVVKHLASDLSLYKSTPCDPPKWEPEDGGNELNRAFGNPYILNRS